MQIENELERIFKEHSTNKVIGYQYSQPINGLYMDLKEFKEASLKILALGKPEPLAKNKQCGDDFFCEWSEAHDMDNQKCETQCIYCKSH